MRLKSEFGQIGWCVSITVCWAGAILPVWAASVCVRRLRPVCRRLRPGLRQVTTPALWLRQNSASPLFPASDAPVSIFPTGVYFLPELHPRTLAPEECVPAALVCSDLRRADDRGSGGGGRRSGAATDCSEPYYTPAVACFPEAPGSWRHKPTNPSCGAINRSLILNQRSSHPALLLSPTQQLAHASAEKETQSWELFRALWTMASGQPCLWGQNLARNTGLVDGTG